LRSPAAFLFRSFSESVVARYNEMFARRPSREQPARTTWERYRSGRNGGASKASCRVTGTWVRIPPSPPFNTCTALAVVFLTRDLAIEAPLGFPESPELGSSAPVYGVAMLNLCIRLPRFSAMKMLPIKSTAIPCGWLNWPGKVPERPKLPMTSPSSRSMISIWALF
jgi:hypothetical protein